MTAISHSARWGLVSLIIAFPLFSAASDVEPLDSNIPTVLTPTRLRQSLADVPGSVTIITSEMLQRFGITSVPDALRLVPGMAVTQASGNDYRINYHGTNILVPKRMNVLIDGMSVYRPALARVDWQELPVVIEDIDRIEVFRGSNSASYGANSMLAVVNIITKHPKEAEGTTLATTAGSLQSAEGMARYGGKIGESTTYRVTVDRQKDSGFDYSSLAHKDHDGTQLDRFNFRSITDIANNETLDLQAAVVQGTSQTVYADKYQRTFPDVYSSDYYLNALWQKSLSPDHDIQIQAYTSSHHNNQEWTTCPPTAMFLPQMFNLWQSNPGYATTILAGHVPSGGSAQDNALATAAIAAIRALGTRAATPMCVDANQNYVEGRTDIEFQDTFVFSDALRMVSGIGARQDMGDSQTYLGGRITNDSYRVFSNVEYRPYRWLNVNVGGFLETDQITGTAFSPRIAFNTHISDNHTLRFVVSKGTRMPDIQEQDANWTYSVNFPTPLNGATQGRFFQSAQSPGNLNSEKILSREIGYFGNFSQYGLMIDARIFDDSLTDLISEKLQLSSFLPTNNNSDHLSGAEFQANYEPSDRWMLFLAYSYLHSDGASTPLEQTQYANNTGAFGVSHLMDNGWRASLAFYGSGSSTASQTFYGREDLTFSKTSVLGKNNRLMTSFIIRHLDNTTAQYYQDVGQTVESRYNRAMQYFATVKISF